MGGIGLSFQDNALPPMIPIPDEPRIPLECIWSSQILHRIILPQTVFAAECGYTTFRGYTGTGHDKNRCRTLQYVNTLTTRFFFGVQDRIYELIVEQLLCLLSPRVLTGTRICSRDQSSRHWYRNRISPLS